jgi:hypothetical protein
LPTQVSLGVLDNKKVTVTDCGLDCLQQATADQAFTNAKEAGDIDGMIDALLFRAIERNTGSVGLESVLCESIEAVNPEIAAITQHQDAAADGAQELNKEIAAELARQIATLGGDPLRANEASTFAPGEIGDPTANGGGCNDAEDVNGCINTLGLRVDDLSEEEILAAVEGIDAEVVDDAEGAADAEDVADVEDAVDVEDDADAGVGACNANIVFGIPSDGRNEDAFEPADLSLFSHGSALNIAVITNFICSQLSSKCSVSDSVIANCEVAAAAASGLLGQDAADAFNSLLGF